MPNKKRLLRIYEGSAATHSQAVAAANDAAATGMGYYENWGIVSVQTVVTANLRSGENLIGRPNTEWYVAITILFEISEGDFNNA